MSDQDWRPLGTMFHDETTPDYLTPGEGFWKGERLPPGRYRVGHDPWIEFELRGEEALTNAVWIPEVREWPFGEFPLAIEWFPLPDKETTDGYVDRLKEALARKVFWRASEGRIEIAEDEFDVIIDAARLVVEGQPLSFCAFHVAAGDGSLDCWGAGLDGQDSCRMVEGVWVPTGKETD